MSVNMEIWLFELDDFLLWACLRVLPRALKLAKQIRKDMFDQLPAKALFAHVQRGL